MDSFFLSENLIQIDRLQYSIGEHFFKTYDYYKIICVEKGKGICVINKVKFFYKIGSLFILSLSDSYEFFVEESTIVYQIKFTKQALFDLELENNFYIFLDNPNIVLVEQAIGASDRKSIIILLQLLYWEFNVKSLKRSSILLKIFSTIICLIFESIKTKKTYQIEEKGKGRKINEILMYIRLNILNKNKITVQNLSEEFFLSKNYFSNYFKKQTGKSLSKIIADIKLEILEQLLKSSDMTIKEIAYKMEFTDSSHLISFLKKRRQKTPKEYRD